MRLPSGRVQMLAFAVLIGLVGGWFRATAVTTTEQLQPSIRADAAEYYLSAYNLVRLGIYSRSPGQFANPAKPVLPDAYRPPGLPLLIALFMEQSSQPNDILRAVRNLNVAVGVATAVVSFFCAAAVLPLAAAIVVGFAVAASPHLVSFSVYLLTETPAAFVIALFLATATLGPPESPRAHACFFLLLGALIGGLSLFRPVFLAFTPLIAFAFRGRRDMLSVMTYVCLGAAVVIGPWFIRNALTVRHDVGDASLLATTILDGSYRGYVWQGNPSTFPYPRFADPTFETARRNLGLALTQVWNRIATDPVGMAYWYLIEKTRFLLQWSNVDGAGDVFIYPVTRTPFKTNRVFMSVHDIYWTIHWVVLALAGFAAVAVWTPLGRFAAHSEKLHVLKLASLLLGYLIVIHIPFFTASRYAVPTYPAIYLLAIATIVMTFRALLAFHASRGASVSEGA